MKRSRVSDLCRGWIRGGIAAMAMSGMRTLTTQFGLVMVTPPEAVVKRHVPGLLSRIPGQRRQGAVELVHGFCGAAGGVLFATAPRRWRERSWAGPAYGLLLWTGFETVLAPLLDVSTPPARNWPGRVAVAFDHVLHGMVLSEMRGGPSS